MLVSLNSNAELFEFMKVNTSKNNEVSESSQYPPCIYMKRKIVSFTAHNAKDKLEVSIKGESCRESILELKLISENGSTLHTYVTTFKKWYWSEKELPEKVKEYANKLFEKSITVTSTLPIKFKCEIEIPNCVAYERNVVNMDEYLKLTELEIPMISHATYYEGWASWIYDKKINKMKKVYEGGL